MFGRCILENDALPCSQDIVENRLGSVVAVADLVTQVYVDSVATGYGFRRDPRLTITQQDQQAALRPRLLNRHSKQSVDQLLEHDLARDGLRQSYHGREIEMFDRCLDRPRRAERSGSSCVRCGENSSSCRTLPSAPQRR